jgi:hypothetical protein
LKTFLWNIAGADSEILKESGIESQKSFYTIGVLYVVISIFVFLGFLGMFYGVFESLLIAVLGAGVISFVISIIYALILMSLEPVVLPFKTEPGSLILSYFIRYFTVLAFALVVSKCFEMILINILESLAIIRYDGAGGYISHLIEMNKDYPAIWVITIMIVGLFVAPIYLRKRLNKSQEYYSIKKKKDRRMVLDNYNEFVVIRDGLFKKMCFEPTVDVVDSNEELKSFIIGKNTREFIPHIEKYIDPPFNTKLKDLKRDYKTSKDFTHLKDWL